MKIHAGNVHTVMKSHNNNPRKLEPKLRIDAVADLRSNLFNMVSRAIEGTDPIYKSCLNCINFKEENETCGLTNPSLRPPARVIAYGCKQWEDIDEIPF